MTQLRYVPDANEAYSLESLLRHNLGFTFNPIAIDSLLSRWTKAQIVEAVQVVYVKATMGCDTLLAATEAYLDTKHP